MNEPGFISESRPVDNFERVLLRDFGRVVLRQGEPAALTIEADPDLMAKIGSEVVEGRLILQVGRDWSERIIRGMGFFHFEHLTYLVTLPTACGLEISGSGQMESDRLVSPTLDLEVSGQGDISIDQLNAEKLSIHSSGQGKVQVVGHALEVSVIISGLGEVDLSGFQVKKAKVGISGRGNVQVWAEQTLTVDISGMGNVTYLGNPRLEQSISGLGELIQLSPGEDKKNRE